MTSQRWTSQAQPKERGPIEWLGKAIILVKEHPDWSDAKIAREVERSPSTPSRHEVQNSG